MRQPFWSKPARCNISSAATSEVIALSLQIRYCLAHLLVARKILCAPTEALRGQFVCPDSNVFDIREILRPTREQNGEQDQIVVSEASRLRHRDRLRLAVLRRTRRVTGTSAVASVGPSVVVTFAPPRP